MLSLIISYKLVVPNLLSVTDPLKIWLKAGTRLTRWVQHCGVMSNTLPHKLVAQAMSCLAGN